MPTDNDHADNPADSSTDGHRDFEPTDELGDLRWVLECAEQTPAGVSFYPPDDLVMRASAETLAPQPGYLVVDLHGTAERAKVGPRWLDAHELATVLKASPVWDGRPIFLMCCDSGRRPHGFAQQLADQLRTEVKAPDKLAWSDFAADGRAQPYSSDGFLDSYGLPRPVKPPTGTFVTFRPREAADPRHDADRAHRIAADHAAAPDRTISVTQQRSGRRLAVDHRRSQADGMAR